MNKLTIFVVYVLLLFSSYAEAGSWEELAYSNEVGSCATRDLNFTSLRFTKLALGQRESKLFMRVLVFLRPDNTQAIRLTTQELLGCQTNSKGEEICSYRPITNEWVQSSWIKDLNSGELNLGIIGNLHFNEADKSFSIKFPTDFSYPELAGKSFQGKMVLVNFNSFGVNTANLCNSLQ